MEYCENGELFNYIVDRQKLDEDEASYFFYQLVNGLDYIHHKKIVHRDLKPENLLLGKGNILKIIDFGLSNYYEEEKLLSTPCGSPCYASPEMVCGNNYNGLMIDIWSCGIIIYAMTCGFLPFEDVNNEILFKKIMECTVDYPEFLSNNTVDIMKRILVIDPNKRITIPEIRKHPFYLKGKSIFELKHEELVYHVEKIIDEDNDENTIKEFKYNQIDKNTDINIKKSKSTNFMENEDIDNNNLYKNKFNKFFIERNILPKEYENNTTKRENSSKKEKNNKSNGLISKKYHISIHSKDKDSPNKEIKKVMSINYELKDIKNNPIDSPINNPIKKIRKDFLGLIEKKINTHNCKDIFNANLVDDLSTQNLPLSNDFPQKNSEDTQNIIEGYQNINKNKILIPHEKGKVDLSLLQQLLKKEKLTKYFKEKNNFINSPINKKNNDNISDFLFKSKKQRPKNKIKNSNFRNEYKNKIKSLNYEKNEKIENYEQNNDNSSNPTNRSEKANNKSILSYNINKKYENSDNDNENNINIKIDNNLKINNNHHNNLELLKYGISNKDINEILFTNNKNIKLYEPNTTKMKHNHIAIEDISNNDNNANNCNSGNYNNNIHIKNLRILNNNNYNNIKNITNINNVKSINNIIICNSPLKSLIKDVQYLTKINTNNNLPNINNNAQKEINTTNNNNINTFNTNQNTGNISCRSNNNILIPKILISKEINNLDIYNIYNTSNLNKLHISSLNKKLNSIKKNINKKKSVNNLINKYKNRGSSIEQIGRKTLSKKQFSERNINSYGINLMNLENENNSTNNKNNYIVYTTKNKMNLNKIKNNKLDPFSYGRNGENLITLKKIKYNNN